MSKRNGKKVISIQENENVCPICDSRFATHIQLNVHTRMHNREKPYVCQVCIEQFTYEITRNGKTPYLCSICYESFVDINYFKLHIHSHTRSAKKPFVCEICNKCETINGVYFRKKSEPLKHTPITCESSPPAIDASAFCQIMMSSSTTLPHKVIHKLEKTILCALCEKTFYTMTALKVHKRIHTGEKPYHCKICTKRFTTNSQLKIHNTWHTGLKPVCKVCSQGFTTNSHLREHMRVHTGERPYACDVCHQSFTQCGSLRRHFKRKHIDSFLCHLCHEQFKSKGSLKMHVMVMHRRK